jgi:beta-lactamase regulating signal transducer with metallopeptidase domain
MAIKRDTGAVLKQLVWVIGGIALVFALIHFAPIISHGS